ncbi:MAG: hypothetical protein GX817_07230, partial [Elusimicrobia bacterium]|nr:hypothetical protein [Elusimicrobiota bacterium]
MQVQVQAESLSLSLIEEGELDFCTITEEKPSSLTEEFDSKTKNRPWLDFDNKLWLDVKEGIETDTFDQMRQAVQEARSSTDDTVISPDMYPDVRTELPYQAQMSITGRKSISMKYGFHRYFGDEDKRTVEGTPAGVPSGFEMDQELKVRIQGQVGDKISVNVDYVDAKPAYDEDARKISVIYKGDPGEVIQQAAFGDINLSLPSTSFVGYSKTVFGASVKGQYDKLKFMAIGSQTKGTTDVREFYGQTSFQKVDIRDTSYIRRRYYSANLNPSHLPLDAGSLKIYIDDRDPTTIVEKNKTEMTVGFYSSTMTHTGYFYQLVAGRDFYLDNKTGIIDFRERIESNYVIAVEYRYSFGSGEVGYSSDPVIIKSVDETFTTELKNRYSFGSTRIMRDNFVIKFLDHNREVVSLPAGTYRIDYDLGILEFTDPEPFYNSSETPGYSGGGFSEIYRNVNPKSHYIIYIEYKRMLSNYFLRPNIFRGS